MKSSNLINCFDKLVLNEQRDNTIICAHHDFPMVKSPKYVVLKKNKKKKTLNKLIFPISKLKNKIKKIKQNIIILAHQFPNVQPLLLSMFSFSFFCISFLDIFLQTLILFSLIYALFLKKKLFVFFGHELIVGKKH